MQCARVFFTPTWIACMHRLILMLFLKRWMRPEGGASPRCFCCSHNQERRSTNPASVCWASQERRQPGKKGSTHTERIQTQANCVLTNGLRFPAGCSCGLWMSKSISPPFHMRHNKPSAGKRGWWRGTDLTNLNERSVMRANSQVTKSNKRAIRIYRFAHLCNADAGRRLRVAKVWLRLCTLRLYFNCGDWK